MTDDLFSDEDMDFGDFFSLETDDNVDILGLDVSLFGSPKQKEILEEDEDFIF